MGHNPFFAKSEDFYLNEKGVTRTLPNAARCLINVTINWRLTAAFLVCMAHGAVATNHWAFVSPARPTVPAPGHPIDAFIRARLQKEAIKPSPEADRTTLIRRLSLDLTGLPPSSEEVDAFTNDPSGNAYENLVDRLLTSPHFGEQWARHWLDLARYADSDGYEKDAIRLTAFRYRDWVIHAINADMPFDRFTIEQIAGDLLPDATVEKKGGTGFHRQTLTNKEGGVDQEEYRCKATVDRVNTTAAAWLGLTLACAECHNHKYDPISQREYYQMYAFFNDASEFDLVAITQEDTAAYESARKLWSPRTEPLLKKWMAHLEKDFSATQKQWEASLKTQWHSLIPRVVKSGAGHDTAIGTNYTVSIGRALKPVDTYAVETECPLTNEITAIRLEVLPSAIGRPVGLSREGEFGLSEFRLDGVRFTNAIADFSADKSPITSAIDSDTNTAWAIGPQTLHGHAAVFIPSSPFTARSNLVFTLIQNGGDERLIANFRLSAATSPGPFTDLRVPADTAERQKFYREEVDPVSLKLRETVIAHFASEPRPPKAARVPILVKADPPRETYIHERGDFLRKGEPVQPGTLKVLHPLKPRGQNPDRLDLARWLMAADNPLTSRVAVNHIWQQLFGRGLVNSVADFGTRGEMPSHPELLDWLATEFPRLNWSRKAMIKLIVMSQTYRQSSHYRPELAERDPQNILLARQSRLRLSAENVRDVHLAVSGLLNRKIGGPSVRPPMPSDIAALGYADSIRWTQSEGADRYRRGLYTFFQRTVPYPMLMTFDAPDSNTTCTRRERSNTPLQALTLLNDPVFFECAEVFGRSLSSHPGTTEKRLAQTFKRCLAREPRPEELARLEAFFDRQPPDLAWVALTRTLMNLDEFITRE